MSIDLRPAQAFLRELAEHNDRDWFNANKATYERDVKEPAIAWCEAVSDALHELDPEIVVDPRINGSIMRLDRDLRFSKDKTPYRTDLGFRFWVGERKDGRSAMYMRVRPDSVGVACGMWGFDKHSREAYRQAMAGEPGAELAPHLETLLERGAHINADRLKRVPKPWDDTHPRAEWLKLKGLVVGIEEPLEPGPELAGTVVGWWRELAPVHRFLRGVSG